jgi:DNA primase
MKYLTLIRAIALLHQHQREFKTVEHAGQTLRYIEVTKEDIALANAIAHEVLGRTLDELPPQTRKLLILTRAWVSAQCAERALRQSELRFTRRQLREAVHWGDTQTKVHLARLVEMEYVTLHRRGLAIEYELVYDAKDAGDDQAHVNGLIDVDTLSETHEYDSSRSGLQAIRSGGGRSSVGPRSGGGRGGVEPIQTRAGIGAASDGDAAAVKTRIKAANASSLAAVVAVS